MTEPEQVLLDKLDDVLCRLTLVEDTLRNFRKPNLKPDEYLTVAQASKEYKISRSTIYKNPQVCVTILGKKLVSRTKIEALAEHVG